MAYICDKPKGSCRHCDHYRFDSDYGGMACFAAIDESVERIMGRPIHTTSDFELGKAKVGDLVTQDVVDYYVNALPPVTALYGCTQLGEQYADMLDPTTGRTAPTYATFRRVHPCGIWAYCGHCFAGEDTERGEALPYVK